MGGVSESCLGAQAATNCVSPHNFQVIFEKPNTTNQFMLVSGCVMALETTVLNGMGLTKLSGWAGCDKFSFASLLSNHIFKTKHILSTRASFGGRWWHCKQ